MSAPSIPDSILRLPARTAEFGALLARWCAINSGSGHGAGLERMRLALAEAFAHAFPAAEIQTLASDAPGRNPEGVKSLRIRLRPEAPRQVLLSGHYDTVFEADDPFQSCRWTDPETLNAPGAADMKGGILTILAALEAFEAAPGAAGLGWEVLLTPDEETGSHGTRALFLEARQRYDFGFVFEPARPNGDLVHSRKGTGVFVAVCHGRAAHAAKIPNDGRNAILALAEFLLAASRIPAELPGVMVNVGNIRGGSAASNVVPHLAQAEIDVRVTRLSDREPLLARLQALVDGVNARDGFRMELKGGMNRPPKECTAAEEHVFAAWQAAAADLGQPAFTWVHTGGASDGNFLSAGGLPNLDGVGPIGDQLHSDREFCRMPTVASRAQLAALVLHRIAHGLVPIPRHARSAATG
jgi:glutamate carboxypeptidase